MILYLYNKHHGLCAVDAAEHNEEGFRLEHTDATGTKRPLVDIDREGDSWVAYATSRARLHHEGRAADGVALSHGLLLVISDAASAESYFMLCAEPGQAAGGVRVFELPLNDTLTIGYGQTPQRPLRQPRRQMGRIPVEPGQFLVDGGLLAGHDVADERPRSGDGVS